MSGNRRQLRKAERFERRRRQDIRPFCTGCHKLFRKTHLLLVHRRAHSCGGLFRIADIIAGRPHRPMYDTNPHREVSRRPLHRGRKPGTVRRTRIPGGSGFRNNWEG